MEYLVSAALLIGFLIGLKAAGGKLKHNDVLPSTTKLLNQRNQEWVQFIAGHKARYNSSAQQAVVDDMLADLGGKGIATTSPTTVVVPRLVSQPPLHSLDNATMLLYFGAFLFLASVGLFLAFGGLSGSIKSLLVALLLSSFYVGGMWLFANSRRLKPAGLSFIAIGLVLVPLFGLSLQSNVFTSQGPAVWLATSVLAIALYWRAYRVTGATFMAYFFVASLLSMFEASIAIVQLPAYYFGFGMAVVAIGLMALKVMRGKATGDPTLSQSFFISSAVLAPLSIFIALTTISKNGLAPLATSALLGSLYYATAAYAEKRQPMRGQLVAVSNTLLLAAAGLFAYSVQNSIKTSAVIIMIAAILQLVTYYLLAFKNTISRQTGQYIAAVTALTPVAAMLLVLNHAWMLSIFMALGAAVALLVYDVELKKEYLALNIVLILLVPSVWGLYAVTPHLSAVTMALIYSVVGVSIFLMRKGLGKEWVDRRVMLSGYVTALAACVLYGGFGGWAGTAIVFAIAVLLAYAALYERSAELFLAVPLVMYIGATLALISADQLTVTNVAMSYGLLSLALYGGSLIMRDLAWRRNAQLVATLGAAAGAASVLFFEASSLVAIADLALCGIYIISISGDHKDQSGQEVGGAVAMVSLQWLLWHYGVRNIQVYAHLWALLCAGYATWRFTKKQPQVVQAYIVTALAVVTVPLALQSFGEQGQFYGWLLIVEQIVLILVGMALRYPLITQWGLVTAILAVLYQLRELKFVVLGLIGISVIVVALYLLNRSTTNDDWHKHN